MRSNAHAPAAFGAQIAYALIAMVEWLILSLLVPAIVVPAVLLLGFAGCSYDPRGVDRPPVPVIVSADGTSATIITLTWTFAGGGLDHIQFERTNPDMTTASFDATSSPHDDTGLAPATTYQYQARAVLGDGETSEPSAPVSGTTLGFAILDITQDGSFGSVDTKTAKCEIAAADLTAPSFAPARMWITLGQRASAPRDITFSKVYIGHKAAAGDAWDAMSPLTQVLFGGAASTVITPGNTKRSDEIAFAWDRTSALILSMYFAGGMSSDALSARTDSMPGPSNTHLKDAVDEAATADATGYTSFPGYLSGVVKIEVAE